MKNRKRICILIFSVFINMCLPAFGQVSDNNPEFKRIKYGNDGQVVDLAVGLWASPLPMDFDQDGDLDLVISCTDVPYSGTYYFQNTSGETSGNTVFKKSVRIGEGMYDVTVSFPDKDPTVLGRGVEYTDFRRFGYNHPEGIYNAESLLSMHPHRRFSQWNYVDFDNDGDNDIIVGIDDWAEYGWSDAFDENGEWKNGDLHGYVYLLVNDGGNYKFQGRLKAEGEDIDVQGNTTPMMADFDGDGDLDIICGEFVDHFTWFENIGTRENPNYRLGKLLENSSGLIEMDLEMMKPIAVDWDGNGTTDIIAGDEDGRIAFIENKGKSLNGLPQFESPVYLKQEAENVKFGALITPFSVDWDNDGDDDLICGNSAGYIGFFENLSGGEEPVWAAPKYLKSDEKVIRIQAGENGSIQGPCERKWGYTTLSVADWDGDGLKDIVINSILGKIEWFKNIGAKDAPKLTFKGGVKIDWEGEVPAKPAWNWWSPEKDKLCTQWRTTPFMSDWNKDGMMDLIMLDHEGYLAWFERFDKKGELCLHPGKRIFKEAGKSNENGLLRLKSGMAGDSGRRKICLTDWDGDGDLDLLANSKNIEWFENVGQNNGMVQFKKRGDVAQSKLAGHTTSPTVVDWNNDNIMDLLVGAEDGYLYLFKNNIQK